jgi:hypothetical protein
MRSRVSKISKIFVGIIFGVSAIITFLVGVNTGIDWIAGRLSIWRPIALVRPICESQVLFIYDEKSNLGTRSLTDSDLLKMIGVEILTTERLQNARIRFSKIHTIFGSSFRSDGMSAEERDEFAKTLPKGDISGKLVTQELPPLAADSATSLVLVGVADPDFDCRDRDWFEVTSPGQGIYHADPSFLSVREVRRFDVPSWGIKVAIMVLSLLVILILAVYVFRWFTD